MAHGQIGGNFSTEFSLVPWLDCTLWLTFTFCRRFCSAPMSESEPIVLLPWGGKALEDVCPCAISPVGLSLASGVMDCRTMLCTGLRDGAALVAS